MDTSIPWGHGDRARQSDKIRISANPKLGHTCPICDDLIESSEWSGACDPCITAFKELILERRDRNRRRDLGFAP